MGRQPQGDKILISTETSCHFSHLLQVKKNLFKSDFVHIFSYFIHVYSLGVGADNPLGQNFDFNRDILYLQSFVTSLKKSL